MMATRRRDSQNGMKVEAMLSTRGSSMRTCPIWLPTSIRCTPCQTRSPVSVTMKDGAPITVMHLPWIQPIAAPQRIATAIAAGPGTPYHDASSTRTTAQTPETDPADKSISPTKSTRLTPSAMTPSTPTCNARFDMFRGVRKYGLAR